MKRFSLCFVLFAALFQLACRASVPSHTPTLQSSPTATAAQIPIPPTIPPPTIPPPTSTATPVATPTTIPFEQLTPTPTPVPSPTTIPSPTPVPQLLTPVEKLALGQIIDQSHELLFISQNELKRWQPRNGQVQTVLSPTIDDQSIGSWQISAESGKILIPIIRPYGYPGFSFYIFDKETRQLEEVWAEPDRFLMAYALSADGRTIGIITSNSVNRDDDGQDVIELIDIELREKISLGSCPNTIQIGQSTKTERCRHITTVPNSQSWLWRDIDGIQLGGQDQTPQLFKPHIHSENEFSQIFYPTSDWSPDGRFQLLQGRVYKGSWLSVYVMATGQTIRVPHSSPGLSEKVFWQWTADNRLLTLRPSRDENDDPTGVVEWWRIESEEILLDEFVAFPRQEYIFPTGLTQLPDGRISFIVNNNDPVVPEMRQIYLINPEDLSLQTVASIPPHPRNLHHSLTWAPDMSGMMYLTHDQFAYYVPADGDVIYDLSELLGENVTQAIWLP